MIDQIIDETLTKLKKKSAIQYVKQNLKFHFRKKNSFQHNNSETPIDKNDQPKSRHLATQQNVNWTPKPATTRCRNYWHASGIVKN